MTDYHSKIIDLDRLKRVVADARRPSRPGEQPKTIVQCHGCFDIVHPGHIRYLEFARSQGDLLVVSITGDAAIDKGDRRPYIPQELRAENLAALEFVDYVVIDPNATACAQLQSIRPDIYVKGHEYAMSKDPRFLAERKVVESYGGRVIFSSGQVVFSSSRLVEGMFHPDELATQRLSPVCQRHNIAYARLARLLGRMRGKRILVLGDIIVERYVLCDATSIASESPMMSLSELDQKDYLGGAAIVATQLAALGAKPVLVTNMGGDPRSAWAIEKLTEAGVHVRALRQRRDLVIKTRFLVDDHKLFKVDRTAVCPLDSVGEREAADMLATSAAGADAAILYDCGYGVITPGLLERLSAGFRRDVPVIAGGSTGPRGNLAALQNCDLLCTSERKLRVAMNDLGGSLSTLAYQMLQRTQAKQMLITLGKRGLVTFDRRSHDRKSEAWDDRLCSEYLPSFADRVVDELGCGESVLTSAALALAGDASLMQAAYLAAASAAIQISMLGLAVVGRDDLRRWLGRRPELAGTEEHEASSTVAYAAVNGTPNEITTV
jgi:rfaE bifunctional protein kinase chain/domain/rfaE bifunctional protein nucleotidyltransferase chain/domain